MSQPAGEMRFTVAGGATPAKELLVVPFANLATQVTTGAAGSQAAVEMTSDPATGGTIAFTIPRGDKGDQGDPGKDGSNVIPTDTAIAQAISTNGSATRNAILARTIWNPTSGILITTEIAASATLWFTVEVEAFSVTAVGKAWFYGYQNAAGNAITNLVGTSTLPNIILHAFNLGGVLCFWLEGGIGTYRVTFGSTGGAANHRLSSLTNAAKPTDISRSATIRAASLSLSYDVRTYGARGNGSADDTNAIKAAIAAATAAGGGIVHFPPGNYLVTSTITVGPNASGVRLVGSGQGMSIIKTPTNAAFDVLTFNGLPGGLYDCAVTDLTIETPNATSGYVIAANDCIYFNIARCRINGHSGGVSLKGVGKGFITDTVFSQEARTVGAGQIAIEVAGSTNTVSSDIHISDVQVMRAVARDGVVGILVTGVDGLYVSNVHAHGKMRIAPTNTSNNGVIASIHATNLYLDTSREACLELAGTAATAISYHDLSFTNCTFRAGTTGVFMGATTMIQNVRFASCHFFSNTSYGLLTDNANVQSLIINGCNFSDNAVGSLGMRGNGNSIIGNTFSGSSQVTLELIATNNTIVALNNFARATASTAKLAGANGTTINIGNAGL